MTRLPIAALALLSALAGPAVAASPDAALRHLAQSETGGGINQILAQSGSEVSRDGIDAVAQHFAMTGMGDGAARVAAEGLPRFESDGAAAARLILDNDERGFE